jgi:hypothetical protein
LRQRLQRRRPGVPRAREAHRARGRGSPLGSTCPTSATPTRANLFRPYALRLMAAHSQSGTVASRIPLRRLREARDGKRLRRSSSSLEPSGTSSPKTCSSFCRRCHSLRYDGSSSDPAVPVGKLENPWLARILDGMRPRSQESLALHVARVDVVPDADALLGLRSDPPAGSRRRRLPAAPRMPRGLRPDSRLNRRGNSKR